VGGFFIETEYTVADTIQHRLRIARRLPMNLFEGLYPFEVVMMVMGVFLFLVLTFLLVYMVVRKRKFVALLGFFLIPVVLVGYPSIQSVEFSDGVIKIDKATQALDEKPATPQTRQELQDMVARLSARPASQPQTLTVIAKAQYALGDEKAATANLQKALQADPAAPEAKQLQHKIELIKNLNRISSEVEAHPENQQAKSELQTSLKEASEMKVASSDALIQIARAQTALGDHQKALETANRAIAINPQSAPALLLQRNIQQRIANPGH
jgi:tetratricopeptide (TPR) repeat protein